MREPSSLLARYRPLFSLTVEHQFFADNLCRGLRLEPYRQSATLMEKGACVWRPQIGGVAVYADVSRLALLRSWLAEATPAFSLGFQAFAEDPLFDGYTGGFRRDTDSTLSFASGNAVAEDAGARYRLHAAECVSDADRASAQRAELPAGASCWPAAPKFDVWIKVDPDAIDATSSARDAAGRDYYLRFASRETLWQYNVFGDFSPEQVSVVDLADKTEFAALGPRNFANGRAGQRLRSRAPIALRERSAQRFQLRLQDHGSERVIVKRLPVASAGQFNIEEHEGAPTWVSEIYVNC
ncbi:MAG: hypothetical protein HY255_10800 [Betaproteobacteria bacterium]|nr:hypothetical protein [Betaproteobacteria bacterium]